MTNEEMTKAAIARVTKDNPDCSQFNVTKTFDNVMDGTLITVTFKRNNGNDDSNNIFFRGKELRSYRWHSDVLSAVSGYKEHRWLFRLIELAGVNGVIALVLILILSGLLFAILWTHPETYQNILEIVKLSFTTILGYFFGSQSVGKKSA